MEELSEYERERQEKIRRNQEMLKAMQITSPILKPAKAEPKEKVKAQPSASPSQATRRSSRLSKKQIRFDVDDSSSEEEPVSRKRKRGSKSDDENENGFTKSKRRRHDDDEYSISGDELDDDDDDVEDEFDDRELVCTLCGNIDDVFTCSKAKCGKVFCTDCLKAKFKETVRNPDVWRCPSCRGVIPQGSKQRTSKSRTKSEEEDEPGVYYLERIVNKRTLENGTVEYFCKWEGWSDSDNVWMTEAQLKAANCDAKIEEYEKGQSSTSGGSQSGPTRRFPVRLFTPTIFTYTPRASK